MLAFSHGLIDYFYDVFVTRFDVWLAFGVVAQLLFTARFIVQWWASERAGQSVIPVAFWVLSIVGGGMTLVYGLVRRERISIMGQILAVAIYVRNLMLIFRNRLKANAQDKDGPNA